MSEPDIICNREIADICGVSTSGVSTWAKRFEHFPKPVYRYGHVVMWNRQEIMTWLAERRTKLVVNGK